MPKFLKSIPRVLVMLSPASEKVRREKHQGILKYSRLHGPWDVQLLEERPFISKLGTFKNWQPEGIITRGSPEFLSTLITHANKIPTVYLDADPNYSNGHMSVRHDLQQTSKSVADTYLQQGLTHFAYVGSVPQSYWSMVRGNAFASRIKQNGFMCAVYKPNNEEDWGLEQNHMRTWLQSLPKPCGLFVAFDLRAKQVLDTCLAAGIRVPEEIAVIGVDNDETVCENTVPTLSSVQPDLEGGGYMAAELLNQLMRGKKRRTVSLNYGVQRIVQRQSSQIIRASNLLATSAVEFIRLNACEGITVPDVVRHLHVSRSFAEKRFRKALGHSILDEIQNRRLERLCTLLRETSLRIGEIGERCGYSTEPYLKRFFKRTFGMTMREYRNSPCVHSPVEQSNTKKREMTGEHLHPKSHTEEAQVDNFQEAQVTVTVEIRADHDILEACKTYSLSSSEIASALGHKQLSGNLRKALPRLKAAGLLEYTIPTHPRSRLQRYRLTPRGHSALRLRNTGQDSCPDLHPEPGLHQGVLSSP